MSGIVSIEMYLAFAEEKKALMEKSQFLEKENKKLRAEVQRYKVELENQEDFYLDEMELIYAQYKIHADQNIFLKSEVEKMRASSITPVSLTPSPTSVEPLFPEIQDDFREPSVLKDVQLSEESGPAKESNETEVRDVPMCERDVSDVAHNETIWCGPEPGSMNLLDEELPENERFESEQYIIENLPNAKLPEANNPFTTTEKRKTKQSKRPMVAKTSSVPVKKKKVSFNETPTVFVCRIRPCENTTFESLDDHHKHLEICHPEKPYICSRCPYASPCINRTLAHEKTHKKNESVHRKNNEGGYCTLCDIIFASSNGRYNSALRKHQNQYH